MTWYIGDLFLPANGTKIARFFNHQGSFQHKNPIVHDWSFPAQMPRDLGAAGASVFIAFIDIITTSPGHDGHSHLRTRWQLPVQTSHLQTSENNKFQIGLQGLKLDNLFFEKKKSPCDPEKNHPVSSRYLWCPSCHPWSSPVGHRTGPSMLRLWSASNKQSETWKSGQVSAPRRLYMCSYLQEGSPPIGRYFVLICISFI